MKEIEATAIANELGAANRATRSSKGALVTLSGHSPTFYDKASNNIRNEEDAKVAVRNFRLSKFCRCKICAESYVAPRERASPSGELLPQAMPGGVHTSAEAPKLCATLGQQVNTALALQVVSSHLLGVLNIESVLSVETALVNRLLPHAASEGEALKRPNFPRLFLLDGCSLTFPLGPLSGRLRANSPGSKFLALLSPDRSGEAAMIRLFHWGFEGMVVLDENWKSALPKAVIALLSNELWIPPEVLLDFVKRMRILLNRQLLPGQSLTARENHVLQLLFRRLTNKEIACDLKISERTAKFHVCNVFNKLGMENRKNLFETFGLADT